MDKHLISSLIGSKNKTIFEVGAHHGEDTKEFSDIFIDSRIYAFEPDPRAYKRLIYNFDTHSSCLLFDYLTNSYTYENTKTKTLIYLYDFAISNTDGSCFFYQSSGENFGVKDWDFSGSICKPKKHIDVNPWCKFEQEIIVDTTTIDTFCYSENIGMIDFLWIDAQGAEHLVLGGAKKMIDNTRYIYTEFDNQELYEGQKNLNYLKGVLNKFQLVGIYDNNVLFENIGLKG